MSNNINLLKSSSLSALESHVLYGYKIYMYQSKIQNIFFMNLEVNIAYTS